MQFGPKPLFESISVKFGEDNRYGLIDASGCGKSTFIEILSGDLESSAGDVILEPDVRLGRLRQDRLAYEDMHVLDVVMIGHTKMWTTAQERDAIYANPEATNDDYMKATDLEARYTRYDGHTAEAHVGELLMGVGIPTNQHNGTVNSVAPDWELHVLLAQALFSNPDVLLLDKSTNNLNINTIRRLESMPGERNSAMITISYGRHFLNSVCTHMADMDYDTLKVYPGNYDDYMQASLQAREHLQAASIRARERISDLQNFVRRFSANRSKARQATSRLKVIDKVEVENIKPSSRRNPFIHFEMEKKLYNLAVETESARKTYDRKVFDGLAMAVQADERIAIIGENDTGKTTLLRCLLSGTVKTDVQHGIEIDGDTIKRTKNVSIGYVPQDAYEEFPEDRDLMDWMGQWMQPGDDGQSLRGTMGHLLFSADDIKKNAKMLSGGEEGRMIQGKLMLGRHNVLALDEPVNRMDMESTESLQITLNKFEDTLIFVSCDRELISALATRVIEVRPDGTLTDYLGTYNEYLQNQDIEV